MFAGLSGLDAAVYAFIGLIGSFCSGMLGVGGAIVTYPLLYFLPPIAGAYAMSPIEISSATMLQVFASTGIGMVMYRKSPWLSRYVILVIGGGMLGGSLLGSLLSGYLPGSVIHITYGLMALMAVFLLFRREKGELHEELPTVIQLHLPLAISLSAAVGTLSGIVGAGGSFLLIPVMIRFLKLPIRTAIASSLTIVFLSSIGGVIGKLSVGHIRYDLTLLLVLVSLLGSMIGAKVGQRMNTQLLRVALAVIILIAAANIWGEMVWNLYATI